MPYKEHKIKKHRWTISEVTEELNNEGITVDSSGVRFWIKELHVEVDRDSKNFRYFSENQRDMIHLIGKLLHKRGMTIRGAREVLRRKDELLELIHIEIITKDSKAAAESILKLFY